VGRVSVVDGRGELLLDRFVAPTRPVTDHLTDMTGIRHALFSHYKARCIFLFKLATLWIYINQNADPDRNPDLGF
jgi:hypothetical protein